MDQFFARVWDHLLAGVTGPMSFRLLLQPTVAVFAVVLDIVYQTVAARFVYPGEALLVAVLLACVPYLLIRGPVTRLFRSQAAHPRTGHP